MEYDKFINKKVMILFDDGQSVSKKIGIITKILELFIEFKEENKINFQLIPTDRIVRIEEIKDGYK